MPRRWIDATARDYVIEDGEPRRDETRASQVVYLLALRKGSSAVAPDLGNDWLNDQGKIEPGSERRCAQLCEEALSPLTAPRFIWNLDIGVEIDEGGIALLTVAFEDDTGAVGPLNLTLPRGA